MKSPPGTVREPEAVLSLVGLAHRAGAVARGIDATRRALRRKEAKLVLIAGDASATQVEKIVGLLRHGDVPYERLSDREGLGAALGSAALSAIAVNDASFAEQVLRRLPSEEGGRA